MVRSKRNLNWMDLDMSELDLKKLVAHFGQSNKAEGKSPKTTSWYKEMNWDYINYLEKTGRKEILTNLDIDIVREFIVHEQGRGLSAYTVQGKVEGVSLTKSSTANILRTSVTEQNDVLLLKFI